MAPTQRQPLGIELVRKGIVNENDISKALDYQRANPNMKLGDILNEFDHIDSEELLKAMGEILGEKTIYLRDNDIKIDPLEYIPMDVMKTSMAIPFEVESGKIKVCFKDTVNNRTIESIRLLMLNKGLVLDKYITFQKNVKHILSTFEAVPLEKIQTNSNVSGLIDNIIKSGIEKRASDIHIEPMEEKIRVRYRIDGQLFDVADLDKEKQTQIIGRLKAISDMHQEKQESQDGRILLYPEYNIRVSSQKNIYGEKFVLRMLKKNANIRDLFELGFPNDPKIVNNAFNRKNSITVVAAPTGEGKTTTLYSIISYLDNPDINITTVEDPVEIRIQGLNQIEIDERTSFSDSLRTVLRQDPDIILVGEIRDKETAEIAMQAGQTGHYVLSTIHTTDAIEVIARLRKIGITDYDISSTLATSVSQRLVRKLCDNCKKERPFNPKELEVINSIGERYNIEFDLSKNTTYEAVGCSKCNNSGYYERIGIFEILIFDDNIKELVVNRASTYEIKKEALKYGYKPLVVEGILKVLEGTTTLDEINRKIVIY